MQKTKLGWIISGRIFPDKKQYNKQDFLVNCHFTSEVTLENKIEKFWDIEEIPQKRFLSKEDKFCEETFQNTTFRNKNGSFTVTLPERSTVMPLGKSFSMALRRFHTLERKLARDSELRRQYEVFIEEYIQLGHMSQIGSIDNMHTLNNSDKVYYLPHHAVVKQGSATTKCRVVFDGSVTTDTGISLNESLMVGPKLQDNLFNILLRFRRHNIVIGADIAKMYRCIWVNEEQRDLQRILWRQNVEEEIKVYKLNTLTYGTAPAAYLAIRCLQQLAHDNKDSFPKAAQVILSDFYVDDLLTGVDTVEEARILKEHISNILEGAEFCLRKWISNRGEVLEMDDSVKRGIEHYLLEGNNNKTLGIYWDAQEDKLHYSINTTIHATKITKRSVLSMIAQVFDPLGLMGPVVLKSKLIMQSLWKLKIHWDESLPLDLHTAWVNYKRNFDIIQNIHINRQVICSNPQRIELHCFTDASEAAYGAAVYLRSTDKSGNHHVGLLCAKSRVAPLKVLSLPRLELCGALLGTRLVGEVISALGIEFDRIYMWTDSTIVLSWIAQDSFNYKTFVSNRISEIQEASKTWTWRHVETKSNPADIISRGVNADQLISYEPWWIGPSWLKMEEESWPKAVKLDDVLPERRVKRQIFVANKDVDIFDRYSNLNKLERVVAYCMRFVSNCRISKENRVAGCLSIAEREVALVWKEMQAQSFPSDIEALKSGQDLPKRSELLSLAPFIDDKGLLRLSGRLKHSDLSFNQKHPIILPRNHKLTELIIMQEHIRNLHASPQLLLATLRLTYWPIAGRRTVRKFLHKCVICFKVKPTAQKYIMGQLPNHRITPSRPFLNCGVDYAGPFETKTSNLRGSRVQKSYLCVFICLATKAVHLEIVSNLSTEAFLNSFKRFVSRRGLCKNIYSDNATNFVGAHRELRELFSLIHNPSCSIVYLEYFSQNQINWHFIPPLSPHFGGLWEAAVKTAKYHLRRVLMNNRFTLEEFSTVIAQIESCMNSRPLTPLTNDPNDLAILTPGHFLIGGPLNAIPPTHFGDINENRLSRFQHLTRITQHFWTRWSKEYLGNQQSRTKWQTPTSGLKPGIMVIIKEDSTPPLKWDVARVTEVHPGLDGVVRVVTVKTARGIFKRPVSKLCVLPIENE
ncbi:uncharacterized protein [Diabrotica undecimpunctata]|uniref:uncharacterized protein n=1 Tax=Diabrotica undecimpunctata TaxID=50387 RepID=UPI003B63E2FE